jgi:hypothetical protein
MRMTILFPLALLAALACQWHPPQASSITNKPVQISTPDSPVDRHSASEDSVSSGTFTTAEFNNHIEQLKKKLPSKDFSIVIQSPFVVVGDEPLSELKRRSEGTVKWAVDRLKQDFFARDPNEILDIWLFKDEASYKKHTHLLFGEDPTTPYGYYSRKHKALIMNISTGGGTLVHEIVHPFIEANFPACPPWLNEGLGSLYEQCGEVDGHIHGFTNWRLPGLQRAIRAGSVSPFKTLMEMDANTFYNEDRGINYAQARYLCYYLQEKGLLTKFYREFHASQKQDASGYKTLQKILAEPDMTLFKVKWEKFVLGLRQGYSVDVN